MLLAIGSVSDVLAQDVITYQCARPQAGAIGEATDCIDATITYGATTIRAGRFRTRNLDTDRGEWNLTDTVRILSDGAELDADAATVRLENGEIVSFTLSGSPGSISRAAGEGGAPLRAQADMIAYDVPGESLQLKGNVSFAYEDSLFITCELAFHLGTRAYRTGPCESRVVATPPESGTDRSAIRIGSQADARAGEVLEYTCARDLQGVFGAATDCSEATITYGTNTIRAGRFTARKLNTLREEWRFSGGVAVVTEQAELDAETAIVRLENGELVSFDLKGMPGRISYLAREGEMRISAQASGIVYDVASEYLQLDGDVRLVYDDTVFNSCEFTFNLGTRSYSTGFCESRTTVPQPEPEANRSSPQRDEP